MFSADLIARLKDVHTYAVTPFLTNNLLEVDLDGLARNLEFLVAHGVQVIAVGGGTGEFEALTPGELEALARSAVQVVGDRALVVATLPGNLSVAVDLARRYERIGIRVVLGMPPLVRGKAPRDLEGVFEYYRLLCQATELPLMPYNTQGWPAEFIVRLADIERIVAIKDPCHDPHPFFRAIKRLGNRFVWLGNKQHDPGVLHLRYQMGMDGFTSGMSNYWPEAELEMHQAALRRDWDRLIVLQDRVAVMERLRMEQDDAASVKAAMDLVGLTGGKVRPPRRDVPPDGRAELRKALQEMGVEVRGR
jgi:4-hydroxy-tetrahydrodipicolinate synthase